MGAAKLFTWTSKTNATCKALADGYCRMANKTACKGTRKGAADMACKNEDAECYTMIDLPAGTCIVSLGSYA